MDTTFSHKTYNIWTPQSWPNFTQHMHRDAESEIQGEKLLYLECFSNENNMNF